MIIGLPEPHVREALLRALRAHLVLEDRKDDDVPALAPVRLRLAQHAFLLEPVATERVDAQDIVGVGLGLDAPDLEGVHRPRERQARRVDAPARAYRPWVDDPDLQEREAIDRLDVEEPDEP